MNFFRFNRFLRNAADPNVGDAGGGGTPVPDPTPTPVPDPTPTPTPTPDPTPTPTPTVPAIGADGKLGENWFLALGDEFAPHAKDLGKHKDLRSLITELDYFRKNGVEYPNADTAVTAVERFRAIAGVPATPEGYKLTPEALNLPAGLPFDAELASAVAAAAHKTHTPPAALAAIAGEFNAILAKRMDTVRDGEAKAQQVAQDALVAEWRGEFQANASTVRHLTEKLAESAGILPDDPSVATMANNPAFARMMLQVAKLTSEDRVQTPTGFGDLRSPADRLRSLQDGSDPVWGQRYRQGDPAAYEFAKSLREKIAQ